MSRHGDHGDLHLDLDLNLNLNLDLMDLNLMAINGDLHPDDDPDDGDRPQAPNPQASR